jgi:hypothetical protein
LHHLAGDDLLTVAFGALVHGVSRSIFHSCYHEKISHAGKEQQGGLTMKQWRTFPNLRVLSRPCRPATLNDSTTQSA